VGQTRKKTRLIIAAGGDNIKPRLTLSKYLKRRKKGSGEGGKAHKARNNGQFGMGKVQEGGKNKNKRRKKLMEGGKKPELTTIVQKRERTLWGQQE